MNGMDSDNEPSHASSFNPRFAPNMKPKLSPDEAAHNFASAVVQQKVLFDCTSDSLIYRQIIYAWKEGYCFGNNEVMEKWQQYMACQPPPPIKINADELSIESYKGFLTRKINKDSKGSWWAKLKLWYKFLIA